MTPKQIVVINGENKEKTGISEKFQYPILGRENFNFFALFLTSFFVVYYLPFAFNQIYFIGILIAVMRSKKDYFWIAFFFILYDAPGRLFAGGEITDYQRTAFYPLAGGITVQFSELFILTLTIKKIVLKRKSFSIFSGDFILLFSYSLIVVFSSMLFNSSTGNQIQSIRIILPWLLFFLIPALLSRVEDIDRLFQLVSPFVIIALISQGYTYLNGSYFADTIRGISTVRESLLLLDSNSKEVLRAADSSFILLFSFVFAIFQIAQKSYKFHESYLKTIIVIASLSVLLSATRGWILGFILISVLSFLFVAETKRKTVSIVATMVIILLIVYSFFPNVTLQIDNSFTRLLTISEVAKGDLTAGGTLARLDIRGPMVMQKFYESPILGWGFTNDYFDYFDPHVGHHSLLLNLGILGFVILNFFFFKWIFNIISQSLTRLSFDYRRESLKIFAFALIGIYLIHSTSAIAWGFHISLSHIIFYCLVLHSYFLYSVHFNRQR
jgi:hypothetical protein